MQLVFRLVCFFEKVSIHFNTVSERSHDGMKPLTRVERRKQHVAKIALYTLIEMKTFRLVVEKKNDSYNRSAASFISNHFITRLMVTQNILSRIM